jgi:MATE family multidrug resistance protein
MLVKLLGGQASPTRTGIGNGARIAYFPPGVILPALESQVLPVAMPSSRSILKEARLTLVLAVPLTAGQLGQMLLGFSDNLMVGRLGVVPLAASAFALGVLNALFVPGIGLATGVSVLAAQAHGADRPHDAGEVLRAGLIISLIAGLAMALATTLGCNAVGHLGEPAQVFAQGRAFFLIVGWSLLPAMGWQCLKAFCEALSYPALPMQTMFGGVVLNVGLSWVLIYGHLGLPALGLAGAGWATLITRTLLFGLLLAWMLRLPRFRAALPGRWLAPLAGARFREQLALGIPVALQLLLEVGTFSLAAVMMGWLGAASLAAHQIALSYAALTFMFPLGIAIAVSVRVGQAVGAQESTRVRAIGLGGVGMAMAVMGVFATGFLVLRVPLVGFFVRDAATAALAAQLLAVAAIFQVFDGVQVVSMGALRGLSDVKIPTVISFVSYWMVALPLCYFLGVARRSSAVGIWWGLAFGLAFAAMLLVTRLHVKTAPVATP